MDSIFERTSIRKYKDYEVEEEKVERMLEAAMAAPSAKNQQPWEYFVVRNRRVLGQLSTCTPYAGCAKSAPMAFVACYRRECAVPEYAPLDMSASVENLLLEATEQGLGAVWLGIAPVQKRMERVAEILDLPGNLEAFAIIPCGYPAEEREWQSRYDKERVHYVYEE